ncbi:MarR family transcriptional regulator [Sphingomonas oleivorans]|uniref:MarR family transcriptional regulator n=1 Tax=Sphingomonas oleivorans TaxID=1735121 RepID=UPI003C6F887A
MIGQDFTSYDGAPAVLVFADSAEGGAAADAAVRAAGGRVGAVLPIGEALGRLDAQAALDGVIVELQDDPGEILDRLLDRLDQEARMGRHGSIVSIPAQLIDAAAARATHGDMILLCQPDAADRAAAMGALLAGRGMSLHERGRGETVQLKQLSEEVGRIARTLSALSATDARRTRERPAAPEGEEKAPLTSAAIRTLIRARRLRDQYFDSALFADPAWDMLLDLMAARLDARKVAVSSLCIAAAVPPTTALRWIKMLTDEGLLIRVADPHDGRRVFIELSDAAAEGMAAYMRTLAKIGVHVG